jgi:hypothetical protein
MSSASWSLVEFASQLLEHDEREAVLGDLSEAGESAWRGLLGVLGLAMRRQTFLWKSWKPWLAGFVVALPSSYLLVAVSASVTATFQRVILHRMPAWHSPTGNEGFLLLACHVFLLIAWSWTAGFVVGSMSRGSVWISIALCTGLVFLCAPGFMAGYLCKISLTLFFVPAIWGAAQGIRIGKIKLWVALTLAMTITVLMIAAWSKAALWIPNWLLILPPWYLVAMTWRRGGAKNGAASGLTSGSVA